MENWVSCICESIEAHQSAHSARADKGRNVPNHYPIDCLKLFTTQSRLLSTLGKKPFENTVGKGENAGDQHFLLFPQCFLHN